MTHEVK